ncbi:MAG: hypothetical protein BHV75_13075 [Bacteroides oleiciplenus]|nr:MAG: hypothetical protein BHV75_13075 [Bacteroides oleiciplenus]
MFIPAPCKGITAHIGPSITQGVALGYKIKAFQAWATLNHHLLHFYTVLNQNQEYKALHLILRQDAIRTLPIG